MRLRIIAIYFLLLSGCANLGSGSFVGEWAHSRETGEIEAYILASDGAGIWELSKNGINCDCDYSFSWSKRFSSIELEGLSCEEIDGEYVMILHNERLFFGSNDNGRYLELKNGKKYFFRERS